MKRIISLCLIGYVFTILGGTTRVNVFVDSPKSLYDQTTSSVNGAGLWSVPTDPDTAIARWNAIGATMRLYWNLGENTWDFVPRSHAPRVERHSRRSASSVFSSRG